MAGLPMIFFMQIEPNEPNAVPRSPTYDRPMPEPLNVLLIGSGGREHAMARGLAKSPRLAKLWVTADNPGLLAIGSRVDVPVDIKEIYRLEQFCDRENIGLIVVGPEDPISEGFADKLATDSRLVFAPCKAAARLEADKAWAKDLMRSASIPTAEARAFAYAEQAIAYAQSRENSLVVKAAGLAKGKGVIVCDTQAEAVDAIKRVMIAEEFGDAGRTVIVEERMKGPEISVLALVDGRNIMVLPACQDHKRLSDGGVGPNTGGMGAYCPTPIATDEIMERVEREVLVPTVDALRREGITYRGVLYAGLMLTPAGPKVLEFNVRFGDPEAQPLLARYQGDLLELCLAICTGKLHEVETAWDPRPACCVVLASEGYPVKPRTGLVIEGLEKACELTDVVVDHAGTSRNKEGKFVTNGGRVLGVTGLGDTLEQARARAYEACELIRFDGMTYRRDIASQAIASASTDTNSTTIEV